MAIRAALARIAAKNHRNGVDNPYAQIRKDLGFEFCNAVSERNPYVAAPLPPDCSLISDGAAALVLADADLLPDLRRAIAFRARQHVNDILPLSRRDPIAFEGAARAWRAALDRGRAGAGRPEPGGNARLLHHRRTDRVRGHGPDPAQGHKALREGWVQKDGRLPVNRPAASRPRGILWAPRACPCM